MTIKVTRNRKKSSSKESDDHQNVVLIFPSRRIRGSSLPLFLSDTSENFSVFLFSCFVCTHPPFYLPTYPPTYLLTNLPTHPPTHLPTYLPTHLGIVFTLGKTIQLSSFYYIKTLRRQQTDRASHQQVFSLTATNIRQNKIGRLL